MGAEFHENVCVSCLVAHGPSVRTCGQGENLSHEVSADRARSWTFLTNHARILVKIARNPQSRLRDLAVSVGITERAAQSIVNDLEEAGYITRTRVGRRNHYSVDSTRPFRHPADADYRVKGLLTLFVQDEGAPQEELPGLAEPAEPDAATTRVLIHDPLRLDDGVADQA
jgi:predicted transcriptional regulator